MLLLLPSAVAAIGIRGGVDSDTSFLAYAALITGYVPVLELGSNAFFYYAFEPITYRLSRLVGNVEAGYRIYFAVWYGLLALGGFLALGRLSSMGAVHRAALVGLSALLIFRWFGADLAVVSAVATGALTLSAGARYADAPGERPGRLLLLLGGIFAAVSCGQLALLGAIVCLCYIAAVVTDRSAVRYAVVALCVPAMVMLVSVPVPDFPDYPSKAHVVTHWGTADGLFPLVGDAPKILILDKRYLRQMLIVPGLATLGLSCLLAVLSIGAIRRRSGVGVIVGITVLFAVSLSLYSGLVDVSWNQISPIASISRVVPGWFSLPIACVVLGSGVMLLTVLAAQSVASAITFAAVVGVLVLYSGSLLSGRSDQAVWAQASGEEDSALRAEFERILNSPSYQLVRDQGLNVIRHRSIWSALTYEPAAEFHPIFYASHNPEGVALLADGSNDTAWSTRTASQSPGQKLRIRFDESIPLGGLKIDTGRYFTDFPRALAVRIAERCDRGEVGMTTVFAGPNEGGVRYTPAGFPYYSPQHATTVPFPPGSRVQCIEIEQLGTDPNFDWAISELSFAR